MFYSRSSCKSVDIDKEDICGCDTYWDNYKLGTVCYVYDRHKSSGGMVVYHKYEPSYLPEILTRRFFKIPNMKDLKDQYQKQKIYDRYNLLSTKDST